MTEAAAHAQHLKSLIELARTKLATGTPVGETLWKRIDVVAQKMEEALPSDLGRSRR